MTAILFFFSFNCLALNPESHLPDDIQEERAMKLFLEVRCLVCNGQVVENSNTAFAFEMRKLIRQKISEGKSDASIKHDLIKEFGADILVYSEFGKNNFLLWLLPIVFGIAIPVGVFVFCQK